MARRVATIACLVNRQQLCEFATSLADSAVALDIAGQ